MEVKKVLVKDGDMAVVTCPFCRKIKKISVERFRGTGKRHLRVRCRCRETFSICLEYRKHPRKSVRLLGKSINLSRKMRQQDIIIKNISLGGLGFYIFDMVRPRNEDIIQLVFNLNDIQQTQISTKATVRNTTENFVGCELHAVPSVMNSLGFYLMG